MKRDPGGGMELKFIRTKVGCSPCSGYLIKPPYSSPAILLPSTGAKVGLRFRVLAPSQLREKMPLDTLESLPLRMNILVMYLSLTKTSTFSSPNPVG